VALIVTANVGFRVLMTHASSVYQFRPQSQDDPMFARLEHAAGIIGLAQGGAEISMILSFKACFKSCVIRFLVLGSAIVKLSGLRLSGGWKWVLVAAMLKAFKCLSGWKHAKCGAMMVTGSSGAMMADGSSGEMMADGSNGVMMAV